MKRHLHRISLSFVVTLLVLAGALLANQLYPNWRTLPSGLNLALLIALIAGIWIAPTILTIITMWALHRKGRPQTEALMIGRLFRLLSIIVIILTAAWGFGRLGTFGTLFSLFGGMILGWSLQAPVSGFAAWMLVSVKRPFRPGDRIQFPNLGLTGDVKEIGAMYVMLDQVGGTIGSEEAVGRYILVPNAMLFSQVVINYTVRQEAAYMLDEVVVRITYDSDMERAERILIAAAEEVTHEIIEATKIKPYIRSDLYDYGLYMRLRYQTKVTDRARIAYEVTKKILKEIQQTPSVDLAIPYIYSYRAGADRKEEEALANRMTATMTNKIDISRIKPGDSAVDPRDVEQIAHSIALEGLLQPIVLKPAADGNYDIVAGHLRYHACKQLGWKTIPVTIRAPVESNPSAPFGSAIARRPESAP
jgi:small-conductance mechanosensitive channel